MNDRNHIRYGIHLNGEKFALAGFNSRCVLVIHVTHCDLERPGGRSEFSTILSVSGLNSETKQHVGWNQQKVHPGDKIEIEILDSGTPDEPTNVRPQATPKTPDIERLRVVATLKRDLSKSLAGARAEELELLRRLKRSKHKRRRALDRNGRPP